MTGDSFERKAQKPSEFAASLRKRGIQVAEYSLEPNLENAISPTGSGLPQFYVYTVNDKTYAIPARDSLQTLSQKGYLAPLFELEGDDRNISITEPVEL